MQVPTIAESPNAAQPTLAEENYLKAIHQLGGAEQKVPPMNIANRLNVRAPSVTGMLKRLSETGWINYEPRVGARLTDAGIAEARRVVRRHQLVELFLVEVLGFDWSDVDVEAEMLEHAVSPRLEQAIANYLEDPREDTHGNPIPSASGELVSRVLQPLRDFRPGQHVLIREATDDEPARLRHWHELGLVPGVVVSILSYQPLDDIYRIQIGRRTVPLGSEGLDGLHGEEAPAIHVKRMKNFE